MGAVSQHGKATGIYTGTAVSGQIQDDDVAPIQSSSSSIIMHLRILPSHAEDVIQPLAFFHRISNPALPSNYFENTCFHAVYRQNPDNSGYLTQYTASTVPSGQQDVELLQSRTWHLQHTRCRAGRRQKNRLRKN